MADLNTNTKKHTKTTFISLLCFCSLVLEYPPTGGCIPFFKFRTLKLLRYVTTLDYFVMACEVIFVLYLIYYSIEEAIEIRKHGISYFKVDISLFVIEHYSYEGRMSGLSFTYIPNQMNAGRNLAHKKKAT